MNRFYDVSRQETLIEFRDIGNFSCFLFCEKGSMRILVDTNIYNLERNAMCILPPFSSLRFIEFSDDVEAWITAVDMKDIMAVVLDVSSESNLNIREEFCRYVSDVHRERLLDIKRMIEDRLGAAEEDGYLMLNYILDSLGKAFCYEAVQASVAGTELQYVEMDDRKGEIFQSFLSSARLKFASERRVSYYAEEQNLSPAYFSAVIKDVSGRSAKDWLENLCFCSAVRYLSNPNFSVYNAAWFLHFPDQSSFGKFFKKLSGYSPAGFRKKYFR